ncbi:kismet isoform c [Anaeramoeba flamelloides]|uniref:Kismet isoform c n=1 Tax=Anaeramoeba flamelloides TaxID=1746091 RepID=A0AAV8AJ17_9EUKA|nr:kismet isoform c [Anaeramoeba flamelloides]
MGNELPTTIPKKQIKRYLKSVNKHTTPIVVLDNNCSWVDANLPFLKLVSINKKKRLFRSGLKELLPKDQSCLNNASTTQCFFNWFRSTKKLSSRSNSITLEYKTLSEMNGYALCKLKFFEIQNITIAQLLITTTTKPCEDLNEDKKSEETKLLSELADPLHQRGNLSDNINSNSKFNLPSSPSMGRLANINNSVEILKLQSLLGNPVSENESEQSTEKNETENETENENENEIENEKENENENEVENENEKENEVENEIENENEDENENEKENENENENENETQKEVEIKKDLPQDEISNEQESETNSQDHQLLKKTISKNSRTINETHLDIEETTEEILEIIQKTEIKKEPFKKIKLLLAKTLDLHQTSFFDKHQQCLLLSSDLLKEKKKNKSEYIQLESKMVKILENVHAEKKIKRNILNLNLKYKKNLSSLRKTITSYQKLKQLNKTSNKDNIQVKKNVNQKESDTDPNNKETDLKSSNQKPSSNLSFVNFLAKQLITVK